MKKEISVIVDTDQVSSYTNFDEEFTTDEEIYWAMAHLAVLLQQRGYEPEEIFDNITEGMNDAEVIDDKPRGLLN